MSIEGGGILIGLLGLPFVIAIALAVVLAKILVVTAAGTVITLAHLAHGATNASAALARTGYRVYQEHQDSHAMQQTSADNYANVRTRMKARRDIEQRLKPGIQTLPQEFTQRDHDDLRKQLALMIPPTLEVQEQHVTPWQVPTYPTYGIDLSAQTQPQSGRVSIVDLQLNFREYHNILCQLHQRMCDVVPTHPLTSESGTLLRDADAQIQLPSRLDAEYVHTFANSVIQCHSKCNDVLRSAEQQVQRRKTILARATQTLERIEAAQEITLSPNLRSYIQQLQCAFEQDDLDTTDLLLNSIDTEFALDIRLHNDVLQDRLTIFFADMLRDMQIFGEMVLITQVHESSCAETADSQRREKCLAWVNDYNAFMVAVADGRIRDVDDECEVLERRANVLRDKSIDMSEEIQHGYVAGMFRMALNEVGFPPAEDGPVHIYQPIVGWQNGRKLSFELRNDGTFIFDSEGFGDAECKTIYDEVLAKMCEYGVNIAETHRWTQGKVVNAIVASLVKIGYAVNYSQRNGHIDISATNNTNQSEVVVSVDADGTETVTSGQIPNRERTSESPVNVGRPVGTLQPEQQRVRDDR